MAYLKIKLTNATRKKLESLLDFNRKKGDLAAIKRISAIINFADGHSYNTICMILRISEEILRIWVKNFLLNGINGLTSKKSTGRPPKLTKGQKRELRKIIIKGPQTAGFTGACWRSPMIQNLIQEKYGVFYSVCYIAQLLKNMGFSYQKAKFVSDDKDPEKRKEWLENSWKKILLSAKRKNAYILFGDEASFPQWGSLTYTWALRGEQPTVKTSGIRKGYKVMGFIDYFTGKFFYKCCDGKLNSQTYQQFLSEILRRTKKYLIIIQDGARYHTSAEMKKYFENHSNRITVFQLPAYSPDFNPIEKLWKKIKEKEIHLHYFPDFQSLKTRVNEALVNFENLQDEILSLFGLYERIAG